MKELLKDPLEVDDVEFDRQKSLYLMIREQITHEDELINERIGWSLTSQGFLFIAYTGLLNLDIKSVVFGAFLPSIIAFLGIILCLTAYSGVASAIASLERIHKYARERFNMDVDGGINMKFPYISGADALSWNKIFGANVAIRSIPILFSAAWLLLFCVPFFIK
ncbi:MAG: hypothetical protein LWX83_00240 [Anaerolineae bacterium]|nr:hypothetical protein [Anaerolineae bacterium]